MKKIQMERHRRGETARELKDDDVNVQSAPTAVAPPPPPPPPPPSAVALVAVVAATEQPEGVCSVFISAPNEFARALRLISNILKNANALLDLKLTGKINCIAIDYESGDGNPISIDIGGEIIILSLKILNDFLQNYENDVSPFAVRKDIVSWLNSPKRN
uniref:Uncharacterized protein n=1 Tax=Vespula pensylvanica TaxID=30213 RepID=A0A834P6Z2_VESPE|nr:hypothetical protein H0235_004287 [Vespula pensylvanica]